MGDNMNLLQMLEHNCMLVQHNSKPKVRGQQYYTIRGNSMMAMEQAEQRIIDEPKY